MHRQSSACKLRMCQMPGHWVAGFRSSTLSMVFFNNIDGEGGARRGGGVRRIPTPPLPTYLQTTDQKKKKKKKKLQENSQHKFLLTKTITVLYANDIQLRYRFKMSHNPKHMEVINDLWLRQITSANLEQLTLNTYSRNITLITC